MVFNPAGRKEIMPAMRRLLIALAFTLAFTLRAAVTAAAELPPGVLRALDQARIPTDAIAIVVAPVGEAPTLRHRADAPMNPASLMKLLTTWAGLERFGPAYAWTTTAWAAQAPQQGRIAGDLYLRGDGDPKFTYERLWQLLRELRAQGVREIGGDLVLDRSAFAPREHDAAAFDGRPQRLYNVGPDALLFNFAAMQLTLVPEGDVVRVWAEPLPAGLEIVNQLRPTAAPACGNWRTHLRADFAGSRLVLSGDLPRICGPSQWMVAAQSNATLLHGAVTTLWRELGGRFSGGVRESAVPPGAVQLAVSESPALAEIVRDLNKWSNNVMARQLHLTLAASPGADEAAADLALQALLAERGMNFPELVVGNGAGLSRQSRLSADSLARLLAVAWQGPLMPEFVASLPLAGSDGTLRKRYQRNDAASRAHLKTGSLDGVKGIAGYLLDKQGRRHIVVAMVNHPRADDAQVVFDALLTWVAAGAR